MTCGKCDFCQDGQPCRQAPEAELRREPDDGIGRLARDVAALLVSRAEWMDRAERAEKERDEARAEVAALQDGAERAALVGIEMRKERDALAAQLATMREALVNLVEVARRFTPGAAFDEIEQAHAALGLRLRNWRKP